MRCKNELIYAAVATDRTPGDALICRLADVKTMPGTTRRVIVLTAWAVYVKPDLLALVVDLGLTRLPNVAGIDTIRIVIPRLKVPLIFKSRPHAPQPSQGRVRGDDERPRLYVGILYRYGANPTRKKPDIPSHSGK